MRYFLTASVAVLSLSMIPSVWAASPAVPEEKPAHEAKEKLSPPPPAEVLAKIAAPAIRPVIKTKAGYSVEVDLSKQVLSVNSPKKDIWISPEVEGNQTVEVKTDGAPLGQMGRISEPRKMGLQRLQKPDEGFRQSRARRRNRIWLRRTTYRHVQKRNPRQ